MNRLGTVEATATSNFITGIYASTETASQSVTLTETGSRTDTYSATSTTDSSSTITDEGNSVVGSFERSEQSDYSADITRGLTDANGTTLTVGEIATGDSGNTQTGNRITGLYTETGTSASVVTTTQTVVTTDGLHDNTAVNRVTTSSNATGNGNLVTGAVAQHIDATTTTVLTHDGTVAGFDVDFDSTSTDVTETDTTGNEITGVFQHVTSGTDTYSFTQIIDRGAAGNSTLNGSGEKTYSRTSDVQALTGEATSTTTGTDTYTLNQSGTNASGVFSVDLSGEDTFTETETTNSETGVFTRETDVDGSVAGTRTVDGTTTTVAEAVDQIVEQSGNYIDGDISISFTGNGRYDELVEYGDTSNAVTGTPGMLDHSPTGVPLFMGSPPSLPTAGGPENVQAIAAAAISSIAVDQTGTMAAAGFRGAQSAAIASINPGSSISGSGLMTQYVMAGAEAVDQYCFPAGTEVLMADGTAKRIEEIVAGDQVASANVHAMQLSGAPGLDHLGSWAFTPHGDRNTAGLVSETYHNAPQQLLEIHLGDSKIRTTAGHPFFVVDRDIQDSGKWILAQDLLPGDELLSADGLPLTISAVTRDESPAVPVYNFCVAEQHNYHVRLPETDHFVLVHNDSFGLYTYGNALVPVLIEELTDWAEGVATRTQEMVDFVQNHPWIFNFKETLMGEVTTILSNALTDVLNGGVYLVGVNMSLYGFTDTGAWLMNAALDGMRDNTLFGVTGTTLVMAGMAAASTVATFGTAGAFMLFVGASYGVVDAYLRADLSGKTFTINQAFKGAIGGISNPFGATFGVWGGTISMIASGGGTKTELLEAYNFGHRAGSALGSIVGGLAATGVDAFKRSQGDLGYTALAVMPGTLAAVGGATFGHLFGLDLAKSMEFATSVSDVTDLTSVLFIKCFVAQTPVWIPSARSARLLASGEGTPTVIGATVDTAADPSSSQLAAGVSIAVLATVSFTALVATPKREDDEDEERERERCVDSVFGTPEKSWQELADLMWSDPHADVKSNTGKPMPADRKRRLGFD